MQEENKHHLFISLFVTRKRWTPSPSSQNSQGFQSQKGLSFPKSSFSIFFFFSLFHLSFYVYHKEKTNTFTKTKLVKSHELIINVLITTYKRSDMAFRWSPSPYVRPPKWFRSLSQFSPLFVFSPFPLLIPFSMFIIMCKRALVNHHHCHQQELLNSLVLISFFSPLSLYGFIVVGKRSFSKKVNHHHHHLLSKFLTSLPTTIA